MSRILVPPLFEAPNLAHHMARGLEGFWPNQGERGGPLRDRACRRNHATLHNMDNSNWYTRPQGHALDFNGSNEYCTVSNLDILGSITISCWAKGTFGAGLTSLVAKYNAGQVTQQAYYLVAYQSDVRGLVHGSSSLQKSSNSSSNVPSDEWHQVAMRWDNSSGTNPVVMFVDGKQNTATGDNDNFTAIQDTTDVLKFGARSVTPANFFNGQLADIRIYSRALSDAEMLELFTNPWSIYEPLKRRRSRYVLVTGAQNLTHSRLNASPSIGSHILAGPLTTTRLDASPSFGSHTIALDAQQLTHTRLDASLAFGTHLFTLDMTTTRLDASPAFGSHILAGPLTHTRLDASPSIGSHTLSQGIPLTHTRLDASLSFGSHILAGPLTHARLDASLSVGTHTLSTLYAMTHSRLDASLGIGSHILAGPLIHARLDASLSFGDHVLAGPLIHVRLDMTPAFGNHTLSGGVGPTGRRRSADAWLGWLKVGAK